MCAATTRDQGTRIGRQVLGQVLTRLQAPTCQAWSLRRGQSSCTQGSVRGGWSLKEQAEACSRDPSSPRQVTLLLRIPAPQLTEHCKDQAVSSSFSPQEPRWVRPTGPAWRVDGTLLPMPSSQDQRGWVTPLRSHSLSHACCHQAEVHFPPSLICNLDTCRCQKPCQHPGLRSPSLAPSVPSCLSCLGSQGG